MAGRTNSAGAAVTLAVIAVLVGCYSVFMGLQTLILIESRWWQRTHPELSEVPKPLASTEAAAGKGTEVDAFGFKFEAPWSDLDKIDPGDGFAIVKFRSGLRIVFFDPSGAADVAHGMKAETDAQRLQKTYAVFGDSPFDNNYDFYQTVYSASPAQISIVAPRQAALRTSVLLLWKISLTYDAETGFYSFQLGKLRGFQRGDPGRARYVIVDAFDTHDRQFGLIFTARPDASAPLTQADINRAVATLHPAY
ncbi:MAG TPA: hypothetical protein VG033_02170 [Candidatus Acidoferrales bacterium]|jgi:hypothetical protein|nr:hypothetical protein [Candidatus Acidoferrales bacterium]